MQVSNKPDYSHNGRQLTIQGIIPTTQNDEINYVTLAKPEGSEKWEIVSIKSFFEKDEIPQNHERLAIDLKNNIIAPEFDQVGFRGSSTSLLGSQYECAARYTHSYNPCNSKFTKNYNFGDGWLGLLKVVNDEEILKAINQTNLIEKVEVYLPKGKLEKKQYLENNAKKAEEKRKAELEAHEEKVRIWQNGATKRKEALLSSGIGSTICGGSSYYSNGFARNTYHKGYLEAISPNATKIQIRQSRKVNKIIKEDSLPQVIVWADWGPIGKHVDTIIWDDIGNWQLCE